MLIKLLDIFFVSFLFFTKNTIIAWIRFLNFQNYFQLVSKLKKLVSLELKFLKLFLVNLFFVQQILHFSEHTYISWYYSLWGDKFIIIIIIIITIIIIISIFFGKFFFPSGCVHITNIPQTHHRLIFVFQAAILHFLKPQFYFFITFCYELSYFLSYQMDQEIISVLNVLL